MIYDDKFKVKESFRQSQNIQPNHSRLDRKLNFYLFPQKNQEILIQ